MDNETRRRYNLRLRAEAMEATRRRIAKATYELHESVGPAKTTIAAIADRAGVERATVYRHFPNELSLYRGCISHGIDAYPFPDTTPWTEIADPDARLRAGLLSLYAFYRVTAGIWTNWLRDLPSLPVAQQASEEAGLFEFFANARAILSAPWGRRGGRRARLVHAAIAHATEFHTWDSLVHTNSLTDDEAVAIMATMVRCIAHVERGRSR